PQVAQAQPELVAHHFAQADLVAQAIEYLERAARRAVDNSANVEAIAHLTRALDLLASTPTMRKLTDLKLRLEVTPAQVMIARHGCAVSNRGDALFRAKQTLASGTDAPSHKFAILYGIWACHYVRGEVVAQRKAALEFLAEAEQHNDTAAICVA